MHPILRDPRRLGLYLLVWLPVAVLLVLTTAPHPLHWGESVALAVPLCTVYAFMCLSALYSCKAFPLKADTLRSLTGRYLLNSLFAGGICLLLAYLFGSIVGILPETLNTVAPMLFSLGVLLFLLSVASHYAFIAIEESQTAQRREAEAQLLTNQAELRALKAQINPHFLYNSLNSISALTSIEPARARLMCVQLSDFLRTTLGLSETDRVPLQSELELIRMYLSIEKTRFGSRLQMEEQIAPECLTDRIPALILQPLVENAVVHGIAGMVDTGTIRISAKHIPSGQLSIQIENTFDTDMKLRPQNGFGLQSIRKRIWTLYGAQASLNLETERDWFIARLSLPRVEKNA